VVSCGSLKLGGKSDKGGQQQEEQTVATNTEEVSESVTEEESGEVPQVRRRPDKLWVSQVYEDTYYLKLMNTRIKCNDKLELRPDSTFRLTYSQAQASAWCEGMWRQITPDSIELKCIQNHPKKKENNLFVERGIRKIEVKGDRVRMPRDVIKEKKSDEEKKDEKKNDKKKFLILKKSN
jgi:hypothetical protein